MSKTKETKVTLIAAHTHNGKQYKKGETILVSTKDAAWLAKHRITNQLKSE